ncbi:hypothetical protein N658DRAFT_526692 [Parathielavia hyrcaniae]|uniref:Uncharacterized protein n=1 Tax=Parathielavia hyrcaniae TaxID=113614 RepID=A0AAN6SXZ2_9PEZI|nr:hypothetical protein N658DRAFT_526692 [Parathielavia hyrcaniae]
MRAQLDGPIAFIDGFYLHAYDSGAVMMQLNLTRIDDFDGDDGDFTTEDQLYFGILDAALLPYCGDKFFASVVGTDLNGARFQRTELHRQRKRYIVGERRKLNHKLFHRLILDNVYQPVIYLIVHVLLPRHINVTLLHAKPLIDDIFRPTNTHRPDLLGGTCQATCASESAGVIYVLGFMPTRESGEGCLS